MNAPRIVDPSAVLGQVLADASPDLMRHLLGTVINSLLSAEADAVCGAEWGQPSPERVNHRNGYRHRDLDTRVGTIDVAVPKLRTGTYFPEWLLERRKRAESALISVVATCYLLGVSTRRMDKLVESLGITSLSKSQVSRMAGDLDEQVAAFRTRSLAEAGPFTFGPCGRGSIRWHRSAAGTSRCTRRTSGGPSDAPSRTPLTQRSRPLARPRIGSWQGRPRHGW